MDLRETMSDREKAAFLLGALGATKGRGWNPEWSKEEIAGWAQLGLYAKQILNGGAFDPLHHWAVVEAADRMLATGQESET